MILFLILMIINKTDIKILLLSGYVLSYKRDQGGWEEIALSPEQTEFILSGLKCGSSYLAHLTAHNRVGTGDPSPLISATTKGTGNSLIQI